MNDEQLKQVEVHEHEFEKAIIFLRQHGTRLAIGLAIVLVAILAVFSYQNRRRAGLAEASSLLFNAGSAFELEDLLNRYPQSSSAPLAVLKLAKLQYDEGSFAKALESYTTFMAEYPEHTLRPGAEVGRLQCLEAMGRFDEALNGFRAFAAERPGHFLASSAVLGQARCLEQLGSLSDAESVYEDFIADNPDSLWLATAEEALDNVRRLIKRLATDDSEATVE